MDDSPHQLLSSVPIISIIVAMGLIPSVFLCCLCILYVVRYKQRRADRAISALVGSVVLRLGTPMRPYQQGCEPCCICSDNAADVSFEPCKHDLFCARCAFVIWKTSRACPLCRSVIGVVSHGGSPIDLDGPAAPV